MRTYLGCLPCFARQAWDALCLVAPDEDVRERVLRRVFAHVAELDVRLPPPAMGADIHRIIREETGDPDPYRPVKDACTEFCLRIRPGLAERVARSPDPFDTAVRLAVAGNIIDFSILTGRDTEEVILATIEDTLAKPFASDHVEELRAACRDASSILYLADNAGEIVLDRFLLEQLPPGRVTFAVRGSPAINDATRREAALSDLPGDVRIADNGTDIPGTIVERCPPAFQELFRGADVVLAKGQGNYETLSGQDRDIFFLLRAKCPTIARDLGCAIGDIHVRSYRPGAPS